MSQLPVDTPLYKIAFVAHSPEVCELVRREALSFHCDLHTHIPELKSTIPEAQALLARGYEVIIYHSNAQHPVVQALGGAGAPLERTHMDIIRALHEARKYSSHVLLTSHEGEVHDAEMLESLLNIRLHLAFYSAWDELKSGVEDAYAAGLRVAVGGGMTRQYMEQCGGKSIIVAPSETNIQSAIRQALSLAKNRRIEAAMRNDLLTVLKHMEDGVVCIDTDNHLLFRNEAALRFLSIRPGADESALNRHFNELELSSVIAGKESPSEKLVNIRNKQLLVNTFPIFTYGVRKGAVALFRDVDSLQNISSKIKAALYKRGFISRYGCEDIKGQGMSGVVHKIKRYGRSPASVLISGETGTGKELVAHALHNESSRSGKPFVAVNCAALPETLLESELFGYEEGAFTGAKRGGKAGLFEMAQGGTLFLDEIGEISPALQLRLLRVLEAKELMRIGGDRILPVDVRIISATQKPLRRALAAGQFRQDLYYRLAVFFIPIPPLRERIEDLPELVNSLLAKHGKSPRCLSRSCRSYLRLYDWPGNVRELRAVLESYCALLDGDEPDDRLFEEMFLERTREEEPKLVQARVESKGAPPAAYKNTVDAHKLRVIKEALIQAGGNKRQAARTLGISYNTLWRALTSDPPE